MNQHRTREEKTKELEDGLKLVKTSEEKMLLILGSIFSGIMDIRDLLQPELEYTCKDDYKIHQGPCVNCMPKQPEIDVVPSPRVDYCGKCKKEHGYDCPFDKPEPDLQALLADVENLYALVGWTGQDDDRFYKVIAQLKSAIRQ